MLFVFYVYLLFCFSFFLVHIPFIRHEITLQSFFVFLLCLNDHFLLFYDLFKHF